MEKKLVLSIIDERIDFLEAKKAVGTRLHRYGQMIDLDFAQQELLKLRDTISELDWQECMSCKEDGCM